MKAIWTTLRILFVRLRFILVFVVVGLIVSRWSAIMNVAEKYLRPRHVGQTAEEGVEFYCPMHPSVVRKEMGNCPICGMPLSKRMAEEKMALPEGILARVQLSPSRIQQAGVATSEISYQTLVREIRTVGFIEYDERRYADISARIAGRADELFINFTGIRVNAGDPVYRLYSPDLVTTQEEYLLALKTQESIRSQETPPSEITLNQARRLAEAARERLRLWGITDEQIAEVERTGKTQTHLTIFSPISGVVVEKEIHAGHYVKVGEDPYTIVDDSVVWMLAEVFEQDLGAVREGQGVEISSLAYPEEIFQGIVSFIHPSLQSETRTVRVRVEIPNDARKLKPGMYMSATIRIPVGKSAEVHYGCSSNCPGAQAGQPGLCAMCGTERVKEGGLEDEPSSAAEEYFCPMHPEVVRDKPGKCPKCGMDLQVREKPPAAAPSTTKVVEGWRCSVHEKETAGESGACPDCGGAMHPVEYEQVLAVPLEAVIDTGLRQIVFLDKGSAVFEAVELVLGPRAGDYYPVHKGLQPGDRVVTAGAFLLDAEARLNPAAGAAYFGATGSPSPSGHPNH